MKPVVTPKEMGAIDAAAPEPVEVLIGRAGAATARVALRMLGGTYGRRVVVIAGKGNNGNDGRDAAARLARRGVKVQVVAAVDAAGQTLPACDLVIDAAYGTGFRGEYVPPSVRAPLVLAVDIPSGVDGLTGEAAGQPLQAERTVTFAALKPGVLFHPGHGLAGEIELADIGLDVSSATVGAVEADDVAGWVPDRPATAHKWQSALVVVAGSPGMMGAAHLTVAAAQRAGAGMVRVCSPGVDDDPAMPTEAVRMPKWDDSVLERAHALVIGPGLGRSGEVTALVRRLANSASDLPLVVDGDGLYAVGGMSLSPRTVVTPHDGEFARLAGKPPGQDRIASARELAERLGAVVLLKGPTTVVAHPDGRARIVTSGDQRLATAGTGDVLSGIIGALLARGTKAFDAAAAGAWWHGTAATLALPDEGLVASDLLHAIPWAYEDLSGRS